MTKIPKAAFSFAGLAVVAGVLTLAVPQAAHAVAAALVQVTNTTASPVVTQSTPSMASQLVVLSNALTYPNFGVVGPNAVYNSQTYWVPFGQTLVITSADISLQQCADQNLVNYVSVTQSGNIGPSWAVSGPYTAHFSYPSGLPVTGGVQLGTYNNILPCQAFIVLNGYLTSN